MIKYYMGDVRQKRFLFRSQKTNAAVADNSDIIADCKLNGKICFVLGDIPFGDMCIGQYLSYARALKTKIALSDYAKRALLKKAGVRVSLCRKMKTLPRELFRGVALAAAIDDDSKQAWLNLDGVAFSHAARRRVRRMLRGVERHFSEVHVAVSDSRFIPKKAPALLAKDGELVAERRRSVSRLLGKLRVEKSKRKSNAVFSQIHGCRALLCDN